MLVPLHICVGSIYGQSAGMLPQLLEKGSSIPIDRDQATWIASAPTLGACLASAISGTLSDVFGRMRVVRLSFFCMALGYAVMVAAESFMLIVVGRFLAGAGIGCNFPAFVYVSETAPPAYRGLFLSLNALMSSLGLVYIYSLGGYFPWVYAAGATCLMATAGLVLTFFLHDSPAWLVRNGKLEAAQKSLRRIEDNAANVEIKLKELQETAKNEPTTSFNLRIFIEPTVWKPFMQVLAMSVLQNIAGFYIVIYYTVQFMSEFHSTIGPLEVTVLIAVVRLVGISVASAWMRHAGRKFIGAFSGFSTAVVLLAIYAILKLGDRVKFLAENNWILIALFLLYVLTMTLGIFPMPWTMPYEMFPIKIRGMMCGVCFCAMHVVMFVSVKLYNVLLDNLELDGMILLFAAGAALFGVFSASMLVETHRRTLDEIEAVFAGRPIVTPPQKQKT
ncbi:unnamed protein product [Bemisia tabaci]|uniref:Major facilitator superfamily (MFS) profile domain-containing protein n=1 Tax=Bemisia tabaci TaxID=7038 RepID=A0A9P0F586_BEMTA|nr:unnamed protein product [Bemisia tabaci]